MWWWRGPPAESGQWKQNENTKQGPCTVCLSKKVPLRRRQAERELEINLTKQPFNGFVDMLASSSTDIASLFSLTLEMLCAVVVRKQARQGCSRQHHIDSEKTICELSTSVGGCTVCPWSIIIDSLWLLAPFPKSTLPLTLIFLDSLFVPSSAVDTVADCFSRTIYILCWKEQTKLHFNCTTFQLSLLLF